MRPRDRSPRAAAHPMTGGKRAGNGADDGGEGRTAFERRIDQRVGEERRERDLGTQHIHDGTEQDRVRLDANAVAKTSDSNGCSRPSGTGRSRVRRINLSGTRSKT